MSEGNVVRTKRMGARNFKKPPQPYMCIRDTLMGSLDPCYVNVLSWEKVVCTGVSSDVVPLYGGMKIDPPRTEKKEVSVFAVMAHPDVLREHGKNLHNPKERTSLIDGLLDFVEKMNSGVVFSRRYRVLRDRDITGELKEIWMALQAIGAKSQQSTCSDESKWPLPQHTHKQQEQQSQQYSIQQEQPQQHSIQQEQPQQYSIQQEQPQQYSIQQEQPQQYSIQQEQPQQYSIRQEQPQQYSIQQEQPQQNSVRQQDQLDHHVQQPSPRQEQHTQQVKHAHQQEQQQRDQQQQHFDEDHATQPPQYHKGVYFDEDRKDTNAEQRRFRNYPPQSQNRTKEVNHPMAIRCSFNSSPNSHYLGPGGTPNSQMQQQQQRQHQQFAHEDHTAQPPQYHSSAYYDEYDRQDGSVERRVRARYANQHSQNHSKDGYYPLGGNKYRVIPSSNDHYIFRDPVLPSSSQVQQQNCLPYQAYHYQAPPRSMGQPFSPNVHSSPAMNCQSPRAAPITPVTFVRPDATIHRYDGFTSVKDILETMNRKPNHQTPISQSSGHVQMMHSSSVYEPNQSTSLPSVVVLRHEETDNLDRQMSPGQAARRRYAPPSQYTHLPNSSSLKATTTTTTTTPTTTTRESNPKKSSTISFLKMIADRSAEVNSTTDSRKADQPVNVGTIVEKPILLEKLKIEDTTRIKVLRRDESLNDDKLVPRETSKIPTNGECPVAQVERPREVRSSVKPVNSEDRPVEAADRGEQNGSSEHERVDAILAETTKSMTITETRDTVKISSVGESDLAITKKTSNGQVISSQQRVNESNDEITRTYTILRKPEVNASQKRVTSDLLQLSINESVHTDRFTSKSGDKRGGRLRRRR